jgi:hypothetical protein
LRRCQKCNRRISIGESFLLTFRTHDRGSWFFVGSGFVLTNPETRATAF